MAQWPKTVGANVAAFMLALIVVLAPPCGRRSLCRVIRSCGRPHRAWRVPRAAVHHEPVARQDGDDLRLLGATHHSALQSHPDADRTEERPRDAPRTVVRPLRVRRIGVSETAPVPGADPYPLAWGVVVVLTVFPPPPLGVNGESSGSRRNSLFSPRSRRDAGLSGDQRLPLGAVPPARVGLSDTRRVGWIPAPPRNGREAGEYDLPPVRHRQRPSWPIGASGTSGGGRTGHLPTDDRGGRRHVPRSLRGVHR